MGFVTNKTNDNSIIFNFKTSLNQAQAHIKCIEMYVLLIYFHLYVHVDRIVMYIQYTFHKMIRPMLLLISSVFQVKGIKVFFEIERSLYLKGLWMYEMK